MFLLSMVADLVIWSFFCSILLASCSGVVCTILLLTGACDILSSNMVLLRYATCRSSTYIALESSLILLVIFVLFQFRHSATHGIAALLCVWTSCHCRDFYSIGKWIGCCYCTIDHICLWTARCSCAFDPTFTWDCCCLFNLTSIDTWAYHSTIAPTGTWTCCYRCNIDHIGVVLSGHGHAVLTVSFLLPANGHTFISVSFILSSIRFASVSASFVVSTPQSSVSFILLLTVLLLVQQQLVYGVVAVFVLLNLLVLGSVVVYFATVIRIFLYSCIADIISVLQILILCGYWDSTVFDLLPLPFRLFHYA